MAEDPLEQTKSMASGGSVETRRALEIPDHQLLRRIGQGAYGEVWLARNAIGTFRAIKVVYRDNFSDERPYEREFTGIQKFEPISRSNEGLVDILHVGRNDAAGYFYYVMELADDAEPRVGSASSQLSTQDALNYSPKTLRTELRQRGRLPYEECLQLGLSLNLTLGHLHRHGLIHRDIKPSNIIFVRGIPKLADIGLVTEVGEARSYVGTEGFIPPEGPNSAQADIYSLGKVLYEISMGKDRKDFPEPFTALEKAPDSKALLELNAVILKACATDPRERYQSAEDMHVDLALLQSGRSVKRKRVLERRLASMTRAGVAAAVLAVLAMGGYFYQHYQTSELKRLAKAELRQRQRAETSSELAQARLYAADMSLAAQALHEGSLGSAKAILERHRRDTNLMDFEWRYLWTRCRGDFEFSLSGHQSEVVKVTFSRDGKMLASRDVNHVLKVWDLVAKTERFSLNSVTALAGFTRDGSEVVLGLNSNALAVLDVASGRITRRIEDTGETIALLTDGYTVATTSTNFLVRLIDWRSGQEVFHLPGEGGISRYDGNEQSFVSISDDGRYLAVCEDGTTPTNRMHLAVWDLSSRIVVARYEKQFTNTARANIMVKVRPIRMLPDASAVAWGAPDGFLRFWRWSNSTEEVIPAHRADLFDVALAADGQWFATASNDQTIRRWNRSTLREMGLLQGHESRVSALAISSDGRWLASGSRDRTVKLWNIASDHPAAYFSGLASQENYGWLRFSDDGKIAAINMDNGTSTLLEANSLRELGSLTNAPFTLGFIEDGQKLVTGLGPLHTTNALTLGIWNLGSRTVEREIRLSPLLSSDWNEMGLSPNGSVIAVSTASRRVHLYSVSSGRALTNFLAASEPLGFLIWSPDSRVLVVSDITGWLHFWDVGQARRLRSIQAYDSAVSGMAFSADGKVLAVTRRGEIRLWDVATGILCGKLHGHRQSILGLVFSPNGKTLASAGTDGIIKLWSLSSQQEVWTIPFNERSVEDADPRFNGILFAPDGNSLWGFTFGGELKVWRVPSWHEIAAQENHDYAPEAK